MPDGALEIAENVVIVNDSIITKSRGFYNWFLPTTGVLNRLFNFQDTILAAYEDSMRVYGEDTAVPNERGLETTLTGEVVDLVGRVSRGMEANNNLYFTTNNGPLKLTSARGVISPVGAPPGLDLTAEFIPGQSSEGLSPGEMVGYRVLFGYNDANNNLILGAPGDIGTLINRLHENVTAKLVGSVDNVAATSAAGPGSLFTITVTSPAHGLTSGDIMRFTDHTVINKTYEAIAAVTVTGANTFTYTVASDPATDLTAANHKISYGPSAGPYVITVDDPAHGYHPGDFVTFTDLTEGEKNWEGTYAVTVVDADTLSYTVVNDPSDDLADANGLIALGYGESAKITASVPTGLTPGLPWFVQLYRGSIQQESVGLLSDFKLLEQRALTPTEISEHVVYFQDDFVDIPLGAELYTNENSREGGTQTNDRPPLCDDMTFYKGYAIYAACKTRHAMNLDVIDPTAMAEGDFIEIKVGSVTRHYVGRVGYANTPFTGSTSDPVPTDLTVKVTAHGFLEGDIVEVLSITGGTPTLTPGNYYVRTPTADTFHLSSTPTGALIATTELGGAQSLRLQGVGDGTDPFFMISNDLSAANRLSDTAKSIVAAINRDTESLIYAHYTSLASDVPGHMIFRAKDFTGPIYIRANSDAAGKAFLPNLPGSFGSGLQVYSSNDDQPHVFFASKRNEPEAVPISNFIPVGSKNKRLVRVHALRDSLILLKEDGVYRMTGDNFANFTITLLDSTVQIVARGSSHVINNQVAFLSGQGVCVVTESSVQIVSRQIKDVINPILGRENLASYTLGIGYESEQLFYLTTLSPNIDDPPQTWAYCLTTDAWSSLTTIFKQAVMGPADTLYYMGFDNSIYKERKKNTKIDYAGQHYEISVLTVALNGLSGEISLPSGVTPQAGDVILKGDVITRIDADPVYVTGNLWAVSFRLATNLIAGDEELLYSRQVSRIKTAPFHAGLIGRMKQFATMQVHMRDNSTSKLTISFAGNTYGTSGEVVWRSKLETLGWGLFAWGLEPWGQADTINLTQGSRAAPIVRVNVPGLQSRNTYIQPEIVHQEAAEPLNFQAITYAVRAYGERVSR